MPKTTNIALSKVREHHAVELRKDAGCFELVYFHIICYNVIKRKV